MNCRTQGFLLVVLVVGLAVTTAVVLLVALPTGLDPHDYCGTGFSRLITCNLNWSSRSISYSRPIFVTPSRPTETTASRSCQPVHQDYVDVTSWAVAHCPQNAIAKRLLCPVPSIGAPAQAASDDLASGLPRPKPWVLTTGKNSPFIKAVHVETPLDLAAVLGFYRTALRKRGWSENNGAVLEPDRAVIAFTTADGPALLRLVHQDDVTIADLSLRKAAAANAGILPIPGAGRVMLGNATDEEAVITINDQTLTLAARAGHVLTNDAGCKSPDSREIDLPPGRYEVTFKVASGAAQKREFEVVAGETWGLLIGEDGVLLPVHLY